MIYRFCSRKQRWEPWWSCWWRFLQITWSWHLLLTSIHYSHLSSVCLQCPSRSVPDWQCHSPESIFQNPFITKGYVIDGSPVWTECRPIVMHVWYLQTQSVTHVLSLNFPVNFTQMMTSDAVVWKIQEWIWVWWKDSELLTHAATSRISNAQVSFISRISMTADNIAIPNALPSAHHSHPLPIKSSTQGQMRMQQLY